MIIKSKTVVNGTEALMRIFPIKDLKDAVPVGHGFVIHQIIRALGADKRECFFWATHAGAELDLLVVKGRQRLGFEVKRTSAPKVTPSMRSALTDLNLNRLEVFYSGENSFLLDKKIRAVPFDHLLSEIKPLK